MPVKFDDSRLQALRAGLEVKAAAEVSSTAYQIEAEAKVHVPRDPERPPQDPTRKVTGTLRNSIQTVMDKPLRWQVIVGAAYGAYQEFGTSRIPARPYLVPAVEKFKAQFFEKLALLFTDFTGPGHWK